MAQSYNQEKLERYERYCCAPPLNDDNLNSWLKPIKYNRIPVTYRRPQDQHYRWYKFPRRQNSQSWYRQAFLNLNVNELKLCRPVTVKLKKLTHSDIEAFHSENRYKKMIKMGDMTKAAATTTTTPADQSIIIDVIDLCSDDEENNNDDDDDFMNTDAHVHHDSGNVSQTAVTPASRITSPFTDPLQTTFEMYTRTSLQATSMSMLNRDGNCQFQNHETHQSFLNGAQGSVTQIDELSTLKDISMETICSNHISIDLTL